MKDQKYILELTLKDESQNVVDSVSVVEDITAKQMGDYITNSLINAKNALFEKIQNDSILKEFEYLKELATKKGWTIIESEPSEFGYRLTIWTSDNICVFHKDVYYKTSPFYNKAGDRLEQALNILRQFNK